MHRHLILKTATFGLMLGLSAAASAADLPPDEAPRIIYSKAATSYAWSWTGFYVGANAGAAFSDLKVTDVGNSSNGAFSNGGTAGQTFSLNSINFLGGAQAGYNYQIGIGFVGVEGDLGYMGFHGGVVDPGTNSSTVVGVNNGLYGDVTGRGGFALGPTLIYAKGGWAAFDGQDTFNTGSTQFRSSTSTGMFNGWTGGGGLEYAMSPEWTIKAEYLHFDFGSQTFDVLSTMAGTFPFTEKLTADTVKLGINYRFNWMR
jgi:outer membrane immunogenic protein